MHTIATNSLFSYCYSLTKVYSFHNSDPPSYSFLCAQKCHKDYQTFPTKFLPHLVVEEGMEAMCEEMDQQFSKIIPRGQAYE